LEHVESGEQSLAMETKAVARDDDELRWCKSSRQGCRVTTADVEAEKPGFRIQAEIFKEEPNPLELDFKSHNGCRRAEL